MQLKNTNDHFGVITIFLHWIMAILLIGLVIMGLYMTWIPWSTTKLQLFGWHKEYGILALFLVTLRIIWRIQNVLPALSSLPTVERIAARTVHWTFYLLMFAIPLTGWLITSAAGLPVSFFGLFVLPNLVSSNQETMLLFENIHKWLNYGLIAIFCLHVSAALKHHFINKDDILRRIIS
jgi:cytochrome b561